MLNVDRVRRTIDGRAAPYDSIGHRRLALPSRFPCGSLTWDDEWLPLLIEHNHALRVGKAIELQQLSLGLWVKFRVSNGAKGDRALEMASTTHRGLSVGLDPDTAEFRIASDGVQECVLGRVIEVTLTADPVFR